MKTLDTYSVVITVCGVAQPASALGSYKAIALIFDLDNNPYNGVGESVTIDDVTPNTATLSPIRITSYTTSSSYTRSSANINIEFYSAADSIKLDAILYAEFPNSYADRLSYISAVGCNLEIPYLTSWKTNLV